MTSTVDGAEAARTANDRLPREIRVCKMMSLPDLLNLRFLEQEIAELDHELYQAGLNLGLEPTARDRLGLKHSKLDSHIPPLESTITPELVSRLRKLLQQYGR